MRGSAGGCPLSLRVVDEGFGHGVIIEGHEANNCADLVRPLRQGLSASGLLVSPETMKAPEEIDDAQAFDPSRAGVEALLQRGDASEVGRLEEARCGDPRARYQRASRR